MTNSKDQFFSDVEKPYETVADSFRDGLGGKPLTVRLGDLWNGLLQAADERDPEAPLRSPSAVPLLDDMQGILHWD